MRISLIAATLISLNLLTACTKKSTSTPTPTPTPTPAATGFSWTENGGAEIKADSAFYETRYKTIKAYKTGKFIEINLTDGIPATYSLGTSNAVSMLVAGASTLYAASSGSVIITANASSKMTGTFTSAGTGASVTKLDGKFTDIAVR